MEEIKKIGVKNCRRILKGSQDDKEIEATRDSLYQIAEILVNKYFADKEDSCERNEDCSDILQSFD